jgi:hypothetical protein
MVRVRDEVHEAGHVLNPLRPYQPRLTDGFICVVLLINFITVNLSEYLKIKDCILLFNVIFFSGRVECKDKTPADVNSGFAVIIIYICLPFITIGF